MKRITKVLLSVFFAAVLALAGTSFVSARDRSDVLAIRDILKAKVESSLTPEIYREAPLLPIGNSTETLGGKDRRSHPEKPIKSIRKGGAAESSDAGVLHIESASTETLGPNLIANPSFESADSSGLPTGWSKGGYGTNTRTFSYPVAPQDGAKAAKVSMTSYTSGDAKWFFNHVSVTPGKTYQFGDWYSASVSSVVTIQYKKTDGTYLYKDILTLSPSASFTNATAEFVIPEGVQSLTIFHLIKQVGALTIDNYSLREVGAEASSNLVANSNFEIDGGGAPESWARGGWGANTRSYSYPAAGVGGSKAAKVSITSYTSGDVKWFFNPLSVSPGIYTYSDKYVANIPSLITVQYHHTDGSYSFKDIAAVPSASEFSNFSIDFSVSVGVADVTVFHLIEAVGFLTIDNVSVIRKSDFGGIFTTGGVSITFDDGWLSQVDNAVPKLKSSGLKATFFIATRQLADYGFSGYMDWEQIKAIFSEGHEIGAHTRTHSDLVMLSPKEQQSEIAGSRQDILDQSIGPATSFAYPFGSYDGTTLQIVKDSGFTGARTSIGGMAVETGDKFQLPRRSINVDTTLTQAKQWIDDAAKNKQWLILVFHEVNTSGNQYSTAPETFNAIVDYLLAKRIPVVTVAAGIQDME